MRFTNLLVSLATLTTIVLATCNRDNCLRAVARYQREKAPGFCSDYLATPTLQAPHGIATYGPSRLSSACSCLTTSIPLTPTPPPTTTTPIDTATCSRSSTSACPTSYDPCCAYVCAEAQVPFRVCSPENQTFLAQCEQCPTAAPTLTTTPTPPTPTTDASPTVTKPPTTTTTLNTSTCSRSSASACPTAFDPCCAFLCAEAQVPFLVCSPENQTFLASCNSCAAATAAP